jgi:hypothetical protein
LIGATSRERPRRFPSFSFDPIPNIGEEKPGHRSASAQLFAGFPKRQPIPVTGGAAGNMDALRAIPERGWKMDQL